MRFQLLCSPLVYELFSSHATTDCHRAELKRLKKAKPYSVLTRGGGCQTIPLTLAATIFCAVSSSPVNPSQWILDPRNPGPLMKIKQNLADLYWDGKVKEASSVNSVHRNEWQKLTVAVNEARTGAGPPLHEEVINAVVKFNTPKYKNCRVSMETRTPSGRGENRRLGFNVHCSWKNVLLGRVIMNQKEPFMLKSIV
jgi:hypothetical protein